MSERLFLYLNPFYVLMVMQLVLIVYYRITSTFSGTQCIDVLLALNVTYTAEEIGKYMDLCKTIPTFDVYVRYLNATLHKDREKARPLPPPPLPPPLPPPPPLPYFMREPELNGNHIAFLFFAAIAGSLMVGYAVGLSCRKQKRGRRESCCC